jgi:hypothetical protein
VLVLDSGESRDPLKTRDCIRHPGKEREMEIAERQ